HAGAHHGPGAVGAGRQTAPVNLSTGAGRRTPEKQLWERCSARPAAGTTTTGRARWGGLAGVISVGTESAGALVLADLPERTCFLPEELLFVRWAGAGSEGALLTAARAAPADPGTDWEECGVWVTDGPAVLMDSVEAGTGLGLEHRGVPDQAPVPLPAGRWRVRAARRTDTDPGVDVVRLTADQA
ncbi:Imm21 family immunity protein, partial [Streptomyces albidoflavus]|uniref:Imm21 family immunity protein n=1 Tax=Streptomyces albidoflavus TaxID=1886 RepID=UPI0033B7ED31